MPRFNHSLLLRLRQDLGLSQESLAVLAGIERASLSRYETGARRPEGGALAEICRALSMVAARAGHPPVRSEDLYLREPLPAEEVDGFLLADVRGRG